MRGTILLHALASAPLFAAAQATAMTGPFTIFFDAGSSRITRQHAGILDNFLAVIRHHPDNLTVVIEAGADRVGTPESNRRLSCARGRAVARYLVEHGVRSARIEVHGYGEDRPLADGPDESADPQNRYVAMFEREDPLYSPEDRDNAPPAVDRTRC
ncbi:OmpA family protein [Allosphingosinicella deserti]|uniref:OmpA-like domain-containing protein n=1 Tax=Allosphingosinicella deserti TaxID=2116704 RepID=A0A2P7QRK4_9SPHN|nr:OmpA family protein [Sphingomonas deserti]PSJ40584.1 hypothetical protein C7I55_09665 [Sphingomonas deserti]